ncbi:unnamed protein product [Mytilus coruscus]|uniref:Uncharacterized protein n=1 Tax=Mytilus coruscus TaxID=42192 RepID=A0A6J8BT21_MYTCO|nr:unnamed protein product [Mytilus coruscus]
MQFSRVAPAPRRGNGHGCPTSPLAWGGPSQFDSAFLEYRTYPEEAGSRPKVQLIGAGATGNSHRNQSGDTTTLVTQSKVAPLTPEVVVVPATSHIGQVETVHGTRVPQPKEAYLLIIGVIPLFMQTIMQVRGPYRITNRSTHLMDSMGRPVVGMASVKTIGARTPGKLQPVPM